MMLVKYTRYDTYLAFPYNGENLIWSNRNVCRSTRYGSHIKAFEGSIVGNNKLVFASLSGHSQCDETWQLSPLMKEYRSNMRAEVIWSPHYVWFSGDYWILNYTRDYILGHR